MSIECVGIALFSLLHINQNNIRDETTFYRFSCCFFSVFCWNNWNILKLCDWNEKKNQREEKKNASYYYALICAIVFDLKLVCCSKCMQNITKTIRNWTNKQTNDAKKKKTLVLAECDAIWYMYKLHSSLPLRSARARCLCWCALCAVSVAITSFISFYFSFCFIYAITRWYAISKHSIMCAWTHLISRKFAR